jgi:hypothetical protein
MKKFILLVLVSLFPIVGHAMSGLQLNRIQADCKVEADLLKAFADLRDVGLSYDNLKGVVDTADQSMKPNSSDYKLEMKMIRMVSNHPEYTGNQFAIGYMEECLKDKLNN